MNELIQMEELLSKIDFYQKYPAMKPFIGDNYISEVHKKLLIVGESYYLPNKVEMHHNADEWYKSNQNRLINEFEEKNIENGLEWMSCRQLFALTEWNKKSGHKFYYEIMCCLKNCLKADCAPKKLTSEIAFTNFYQRPAEKEGASMKYYAKKTDVDYGYSILTEVINAITPDLIIITSKHVWDISNKKLKQFVAGRKITLDFTCHPAGWKYWNSRSYQHGKKKLIDLLSQEWLKKE